jgi:hypothetical protein
VRCNSLEEIKALREAHAEFQRSLSTAEEDFKQLQQLDRQIKSFNVGPNPYTWFTMDALEETWRNLQKIIKVGRILAIQPFRAKSIRFLGTRSGTAEGTSSTGR